MRHSLQRAVGAMTIGHIQALERRRHMLGYDALAETECQLQIPVSGYAFPDLQWAEATLEFDVEFVYAPEQRDSSLTVPHFTYGAVLDRQPDADYEGVAHLSAIVREWTVDADRGVITGAAVTVVAIGYGPFSGYMHLTFQGFGAPPETTEDLE